jgi:hypothetical protein
MVLSFFLFPLCLSLSANVWSHDCSPADS